MKMLIGGRWVESQEKLPVYYPYDESIVDYVPKATREHLEEAVKSAKKGFEDLKKLSSDDRYRILRRASELLEERKEEFARILVKEVGKTIKEARGEVARALETLTLSAEEAKRVRGREVIFDADPRGKGKIGFYKRVPIGPIGAITPFNFPLNLALHKLGPAFAVGNSVIHKPSTLTPLANIKFGELILEAGLPPDALNIITGKGEDIGEPLAAHPELKMITFTGSLDVGLRIMEIKGYKRVLMELGSNAPMIVTDTADIELAIKKGVRAAYALAGQSCISLQRIFVHKKIFDRFVADFRDEVKKLKVGDPMNEETDVGPLISESAANRVLNWIEEALDGGAKLLAGCRTENPSLLEPYFLIDVPEESKLFKEEVFGPVVFANPYENFEDAIRMANNTKYGLNAGIFTGSLREAMLAFELLEYGAVTVNEVPTWRVDIMPYGGMKMSGIGREGPEYVVQEMTELKLLAIEKGF